MLSTHRDAEAWKRQALRALDLYKGDPPQGKQERREVRLAWALLAASLS